MVTDPRRILRWTTMLLGAAASACGGETHQDLFEGGCTVDCAGRGGSAQGAGGSAAAAGAAGAAGDSAPGTGAVSSSGGTTGTGGTTGPGGTTGTGGAAPGCVLGSSVPCACSTGEVGSQVCQGSSFGPCACGGAAGAGGQPPSGCASPGSCANGTTCCVGICVPPSPATGCGDPSCSACPAPPANGLSTCNGTQCDYQCLPGFFPFSGFCIDFGSGGGDGGPPPPDGGAAACDAQLCPYCPAAPSTGCCTAQNTCGCYWGAGLPCY